MAAEEISEYLLQNNIKPSYQRLRIYEYLKNNHNHPTVDRIYRELVYEIPTLSKTTVYNTLKIFIEKGIVKVINIEDNELRYDADTSVHGHFKCEKCEQIFDFKLDTTNFDYDELNKFTIKETHIYFKGICNNCNNK